MKHFLHLLSVFILISFARADQKGDAEAAHLKTLQGRNITLQKVPLVIIQRLANIIFKPLNWGLQVQQIILGACMQTEKVLKKTLKRQNCGMLSPPSLIQALKTAALTTSTLIKLHVL